MTTTTTPPARRTPSVHDGLAVTGFVLAWLIPLLGLILSMTSVATAHRDGRHASGLAIAGVWIGVAGTLAILIAVSVLTQAPDPVQQYINCINNALSTGADPGACPTPAS